MEKIKNCPCCDGPGVLKDTTGKIRQGWVGCPKCHLYISWKISPAGAIRKWNQRAGLTPQEAFDAIKCVGISDDLLILIGKALLKGAGK